MAENQFEFDVFLSHSAKDKNIVRDIAERLKADGLRVWFDEWQIKPGDSIPAKIEEGLEQSRVLVLCMSANAFGSDWAALESYTFRFRDPLNKGQRFIPLRFDEAPIKGTLAQFLFINYLPDECTLGYARLLEACQPPANTIDEADGIASEYFLENIIQLNYKTCIWTYAFSPDGKLVLTGAKDKTIRLWNMQTGDCLRIFSGHSADVRSVAWSPDQCHILSGSDDTTLRLWEIGTGKCLRVFRGHSNYVWAVAWSNDQRFALSGSFDNRMCMWEISSGQLLRSFEGHALAVGAVAWMANQRFALSSSADKTIRLWDVETGHCIREFKGHTKDVSTMAVSPDQCHLVSGAYDGTLRLWDIESGRCLRILEGHKETITSVTWILSQNVILSGSEDGSVLLWDVITGTFVPIIKGHSRDIMSVGWNSDQAHFFFGDCFGGIGAWNLSELLAERSKEAFHAVAAALKKLGVADQVLYTNAKGRWCINRQPGYTFELIASQKEP